ncbi:MAG: glycoside hydrolase family 25 protein [Mycobacteriaceae bacterium]
MVLPKILLKTVAISCLFFFGGAISTAHAETGPDVSSWQHPNNSSINWFDVKASGQDFAMVKATEGLSYINPYFVADSIGMRVAGLSRAAYHYANPSLPAEPQAAFFAAVTLGMNGYGDLPAVLDLETTGGLNPQDLINWTHNYLNTVRILTGRTPIIYTYPAFWRTAMANTNAFSNYPLWIADYNGKDQPGPLPGGWDSWAFWQYTSKAHIPGIPTATDMNVYSGSQGSLASYSRS